MAKRFSLHDILKNRKYDHAIISTFTFEPKFFEDYCLDRFKALAENNNISILVDRRIYDALTDCPASEWPQQANTRYLIHPVRVPGVFHPKLFLFVSRDRGLLVVGSANFTRSGLTSNGELVGIYEFELGKREEHASLFTDAVQLLFRFEQLWPNVDLNANLQELVSDTQWLAVPHSPPSRARLVHNLTEPLWTQLIAGVERPSEALHLVSRFFDAGPGILARMRADLRPKKTTIWTQNGITTLTPSWFQADQISRGVLRFKDCTVEDGGHVQPLHAKAVAIVQKRGARLAFGSANCSSRGLFSTAADGNVEVMIVIDALTTREFSPSKLFDPSGTASDLTGLAQLQTGQRQVLPPVAALDIELSGAALRNGRLECTCVPNSVLMSARLMEAVFNCGDGGEERARLSAGAGMLIASLGDALENRIAAGVTLVHVEALGDGGVKVSNKVFLSNLQDVVTGQGQRRERRVRQAQQSAAQFAAVLEDLLRLTDVDQLKQFLTYCDIRMIEAPRAPWLRGPGGGEPAFDGWRTLGQRNLRAYASLHEAAIGFCERHLARMRRHCDRPSVAGIPNFMHIGRAVCQVLQSQLEMLLSGLEQASTPLEVDEWHRHRRRIDQYLGLFRDLLLMVQREYMPTIRRRFKATAIGNAIEPDIDPLLKIGTAMFEVRDRVEKCCARNLHVVVAGRPIAARIGPHDLLSDARWSRWREAVSGAMAQVLDLGRATA